MMRAGHPRRADAGFTLIEVVVATAILMIVTLAVYAAFQRSTARVTSLQAWVEEQAKARNAVDAFSTELRNSFSGETARPRIESIGASSITFYTAGRETPMKLRKVTYSLAGGVLSVAVTESTNTQPGPTYTWTFPTTTPTARAMLSGVTNTTLFVYKDKNGTVLTPSAANAANVGDVQLTLVVRHPTAKTTEQTETYQTTVTLRGVG